MNTPTSSPTPDTPDTPDTPVTPDTRETAAGTPARDTLADEVFVHDDATRALPTAAPTATTARAAAATTATATAPAPTPSTPAVPEVPEPQWIHGPAPFALVLGLLGLVVAGVTLIGELADVSIPWNDLGPWSVVAAGVVVLLVGAIGLRSSRSRT